MFEDVLINLHPPLVYAQYIPLWPPLNGNTSFALHGYKQNWCLINAFRPCMFHCPCHQKFPCDIIISFYLQVANMWHRHCPLKPWRHLWETLYHSKCCPPLAVYQHPHCWRLLRLRWTTRWSLWIEHLHFFMPPPIIVSCSNLPLDGRGMELHTKNKDCASKGF